MSLKDKRDAETGGSSAGATGTAGGQSMKKGSGNCIFELGERLGRSSGQPPAMQAGGTEWAEVHGRRTSHKYSKGKSDRIQGIMAAHMGLFVGIEHPERLSNPRLWRHSELMQTRFTAIPVLRQRLEQSFLPTQIFT